MQQLKADYWGPWQAAVVALLRGELEEIRPDIEAADVDWRYWQPFFNDGWSPRGAVEQILAAAEGLSLGDFLLVQGNGP